MQLPVETREGVENATSEPAISAPTPTLLCRHDVWGS
jgi:hypothetical protein